MKINRDCETIYDGVLLQSYSLVFLNVVIFTIFKFLFEKFVIQFFLKLLNGEFCQKTVSDLENKNPEDPNSQIALQIDSTLNSDTSQTNSHRNRNSNQTKQQKNVSDSEVIFYLIQIISALFTMITASCLLEYHGNLWIRYQNFYGLILNSNFMTLLSSTFIIWLTNNKVSENNNNNDQNDQNEILNEDTNKLLRYYYATRVGVVLLFFMGPCFFNNS
jgi:hypothetical protein